MFVHVFDLVVKPQRAISGLAAARNYDPLDRLQGQRREDVFTFLRQRIEQF